MEIQEKLKCYWVCDEPNMDYQSIVFAPKRSKAMYNSEAYGLVDFIDVRALRKPQFDKYAEQGFVPKQALLEDGWWFECYGRNERGTPCCERLTIDDKPLIIDEGVYCNKECYERRNPS